MEHWRQMQVGVVRLRSGREGECGSTRNDVCVAQTNTFAASCGATCVENKSIVVRGNIS